LPPEVMAGAGGVEAGGAAGVFRPNNFWNAAVAGCGRGWVMKFLSCGIAVRYLSIPRAIDRPAPSFLAAMMVCTPPKAAWPNMARFSPERRRAVRLGVPRIMRRNETLTVRMPR